ncbi:hypothetical protein Pelo_14805 [Pelomyxa schiedti]|nr:hypothetical protein Pelo_14805 [Pelomyxa schiedti]
MKESDGGCTNGWILERYLVFSEQILSFVMSSHARCGASSAASALTSHNAPLVRLLVDKWSRGCVVVPGSGMAQVVVGVSKYTLGVTSLFREWSPKAFVSRMDSTLCLASCLNPCDGACVANAATGKCAVVPKMHGCSRAGWKGKWIVDHSLWRVWKVDKAGPMRVSQPRDVTPWWDERRMRMRGRRNQGSEGQMDTSLAKQGEEAGSFNFRGMVGDGFFEVGWCPNGAEVREYHLVDIVSAFETGEVLVPVDTVRVNVPPQLGEPLGFSHCFWPSKRVVVAKDHRVYELTERGELRFLCENDTDSLLILDNLFIAQRNALGDECEVWDFSNSETHPTVITLPWSDRSGFPFKLTSWGGLLVVLGKSKLHAVDPASGAQIFSLSGPRLDQMLAFMMSSHSRCGVSSPASALTSHNAPLTMFLVEKCSTGCVVLHSCLLGVHTHAPVVEVSAHTLGFMRHLRVQFRPALSVTWMDSTHFLDAWMDTSVTNAITGQRVDLPTNGQTIFCRGRGRWIVDILNWNVWKVVTVDQGDNGEGQSAEKMMSVSQARRVRPWWRSDGELDGDDEGLCLGSLGSFVFHKFVDDDGLCVVLQRRRRPLPELIAFHLVDVERAFETGEMAPLASVTRSVLGLGQLALGGLLDYSYCFWESKRVVVVKDHRVYELLESAPGAYNDLTARIATCLAGIAVSVHTS